MPRLATSPRIERLLMLVPWVMANTDATVDEITDRFGMTRDELVADIELLFMCGLPPFGPGDLIEAWIDGDHVHIAAADYLSRPLRLTQWEAVELLVMGRAIASLPGLAEAESLHRALGKLEAALSPEEAAAAFQLAARVAVELEGTGAEPLLADLRDAIAGRRRLRITYYSFGRDKVTERAIDPYVVFSTLGNWYVLAHDSSSDEERVFRVDRIKQMSPTDEIFGLPEGFTPERAGATGLFVPSPRDIEVTLELGPAAAWVLEVTPHDGAEPHEDGWTRMKLRTPHLEWLERLVLRLGSDVRVVAPEALSERVKAAARRALERYRPEPKRTKRPASRARGRRAGPSGS
jgi:predicted DNA-binding transcriptional regulator YafY